MRRVALGQKCDGLGVPFTVLSHKTQYRGGLTELRLLRTPLLMSIRERAGGVRLAARALG
jgi:hypothetical protein